MAWLQTRSVANLIISLAMLGSCTGPAAHTTSDSATSPSAYQATPAAVSTSATGEPGTTTATCRELITTEESSYLGGITGMALQADLIVEGTVTEALPSTWSGADSAEKITTDYIFQVDQQIAGTPVGSLRVRRAGGTVGCNRLLNAVSPRLHVGDHLLLFLLQDETPGLPLAYRILGEGQGYWQLKQESTGTDPLDIAVKFYTSDTGMFGNPSDRELVQEIADRASRTRASGAPKADSTDGVTVTASVDYGPAFPPDRWAQSSGLIVTGKVVDVLPAQWTTADGQPPANVLQTVPMQYTIITPVLIRLDSPPIFNSYGPLVTSQQIMVATERGMVGTNGVELGPILNEGEHVLLILSFFRGLGNGFGRFTTERGFAWNVGAKYIIAGDQIYSPNPNEEPQLLSEFVGRIRAGGQPRNTTDQ